MHFIISSSEKILHLVINVHSQSNKSRASSSAAGCCFYFSLRGSASVRRARRISQHQGLAVLIINCGRSNSHISQFDCTIGGGTLLHFECRERKGERDSSNVLQLKARDPINIITSWVHFSPVGAVSVRSPERGH